MIFLRSIICLAFFLFSFFDSDPAYVKRAEKIMNKTMERLAKKHDMSPSGTTGGMIDTVNIVGFSFQKLEVLSKDEAREIVVDCAEELLRAFNEDEKIRPHLRDYPFTTENIKVSVFLKTSDYDRIYYPDFSVARVSSGRVVFSASEEGKVQLLTYKEEEPYEEALSIVRGEE
jgi:hypothetical protein